MRKRKLSKKPWAVAYRTAYQTDPLFRQAEKERVSKYYQPRPKRTETIIDGKRYLTTRQVCSILDLSYNQLKRLFYSKVIPPLMREAVTKHYLFFENDVELIKQALPRFLDRPQLETIEQYNLPNLKAYLRINWKKYVPRKPEFADVVEGAA